MWSSFENKQTKTVAVRKGLYYTYRILAENQDGELARYSHRGQIVSRDFFTPNNIKSNQRLQNKCTFFYNIIIITTITIYH